ncbi:uncharacterized protein LOC143153873 [Ptiloglossa arizonensis]|uniref:uncharacterized protein LOC143153873 n=1 Tax=Ptiloglossa arizonensis TaxID=3350558 RepID=UPI003FA000AF
MAPRVQRVYHSTEEPNRYTLRTTKCGVDNILQLHNVNTSKISGKEDFFLCMGLQMKRFQCEYNTLHGNHTTKTLNIPNGVKLRDCSVVILGASCKACGKCFKCETDVNLHSERKHRAYLKTITKSKTQCLKDKDSECKIFSDPCELPTIIANKSPISNLQRKLRLTLRIGEEVVGRLSLKRKYLKRNRIDMATQTEEYDEVTTEFTSTEFIAEKNVDEGAVPHIDLSVFDNSSCKCCSSPMHVVTSTNRYLAGNIVASKETQCGESTAQKGTSILDRLTKSCAITSEEGSTIRDVLPNIVPFNSNGTCISQQNNPTEQKDTKNVCCHKNNIPSALSARHTNNSTICNNTCDSSSIVESFLNPILNSNKIRNSAKITNVQSCQTDFNGNEREKDTPSKKQSQLSEIVRTVKVIMPPIIVPIIVPNHIISPVNLTKQRLSVPSDQQTLKSVIIDEQNSDDEVQEVLRIVRGHDATEEINQESPNRFEQEMLVRDAVRDMIGMEQEGWYLPEKEDVDLAKKRKRVVAKCDTKSGIANDEPAKKRNRVAVQPNSENNIVRNTTEERYSSNTKEPLTKVQKPNQSNKLCVAENAKKNVMSCNERVNIPSEMLGCYGISYYNEVFEINNNKETVEEPVSRFLVSCSGGTENRSNRPTVIDLVNDTDE